MVTIKTQTLLLLILCHVLALVACSPATTTHSVPTILPSETSTPASSSDSTSTEVPAKTPETTPPPQRKSPPNVQTGASTKDEPPKNGQSGTSPQGRPYTWQDGERTITVLLQDDLTVGEDGKLATQTPSQSNEQSGLGARDSANSNEEPEFPVFRSHSGSIMTLPGGVLLALDETWNRAQTDAFFKLNSTQMNRVSELDYLTNGFFIETDPGFPSLELANSLAGQDGVVAASPNWRHEVSTK